MTSDLDIPRRRQLLRQLAAYDVTRQWPGYKLWRPGGAARWMVEAVAEVAPHVPLRDAETLRAHHGGYDGELLADRLVTHAARATAGVGVAAGGLAAVKWTVPPTLLAAPVVLAAETVAVVAVELKLIGELQAVYRAPVTDATAWQRAATLLRIWSGQRGVSLLTPGIAGSALQTASRRRLAEQLTRRFGRSLPTMAPMMAGAAAAGYLNRRTTRRLGTQVRAELARTRLPLPRAAPGGLTPADGRP